MPRPCCVQLDSVLNVSAGELTDRLGALSVGRRRHLCTALEFAVNCF